MQVFYLSLWLHLSFIEQGRMIVTHETNVTHGSTGKLVDKLGKNLYYNCQRFYYDKQKTHTLISMDETFTNELQLFII